MKGVKNEIVIRFDRNDMFDGDMDERRRSKLYCHDGDSGDG